MKLKPEHYAHIRDSIKAAVEKHNLPKEEVYTVQNNLSSKRYRWDLLWAAKLSVWISDNIYSYANDDHIDTALRNIIRELQLGKGEK